MVRWGAIQTNGIPDGLISFAGPAPDRVSPPCRQEKYGQIMLPQLTGIADGRVSEELCASAATMANNLNARAIFVYTRRGYMANFLSRCRPDCPIFAFTGGPRCICEILLLQLCNLKTKQDRGGATLPVSAITDGRFVPGSLLGRGLDSPLHCLPHPSSR